MSDRFDEAAMGLVSRANLSGAVMAQSHRDALSRWLLHHLAESLRSEGEHVTRLRAENERLEARRRELWEQRCDADERITELEGERDTAARALADAIECVEAWSAYAGEYFQEKHDLAGDLARLRAALSKTEGKG